jgi:hypothetical protein
MRESAMALSEPIATVQYEYTDEIAHQIAIDVFEYRTQRIRSRYPAFAKMNPAIILSGAAVQLLIASVAAILVSGWNWIVLKILIVTLCFSFIYSQVRILSDQTKIVLRRLAHRRIQWRIYEEHLETESAAGKRKVLWKEIAQRVTAGQATLLQLVSGLELVIPTSVLSADFQSMLQERIQP